MNNANWVCFDCRVVVRRPKWFAGAVRCPECGERCEFLGDRIPIPPRNARREWQRLEEYLRQVYIEHARERTEKLRRYREFLVEEIRRLEAIPPNPYRGKTLKEYRLRLQELEGRAS